MEKKNLLRFPQIACKISPAIEILRGLIFMFFLQPRPTFYSNTEGQSCAHPEASFHVIPILLAILCFLTAILTFYAVIYKPLFAPESRINYVAPPPAPSQLNTVVCYWNENIYSCILSMEIPIFLPLQVTAYRH